METQQCLGKYLGSAVFLDEIYIETKCKEERYKERKYKTELTMKIDKTNGRGCRSRR